MSGRGTRVALAALVFGAFPPVVEGQTTQPSDAGVSAYLVVLAGRLNVREAPGLDAAVVATAARSERLCLLRYDGDWAEVVTPAEGGRAARVRGFVSRGFVAERRVGPRDLGEVGCAPPP